VLYLTGRLHLRLDSDVVEWFNANGKGCLTRMKAVLKAYIAAQKCQARNIIS
jgi:uncharacterized protein (DUF4415 family)